MIAAPSPAPRALDRLSILNLGCGERTRPDALNVDCVGGSGADVVADLDRLPWPFENDRFDEVLAFDVLEHLDRLVPVMEEIHRVSRPGAVIRITVPHFSSSNAFTDPTHRHYFGWFSTHYFTGENQWAFYTRSRFERITTSLMFHPSPLNVVVRRLANRFPQAYERRWTWMFPAWFLYFELRVVKP
jgi:SAM-dependent methyltransferase